MNLLPLLPLFFLLTGCGEGDWVVETWGEDYIEERIPAEDFADGCEVTYDQFLVALVNPTVVDGDGQVAAEIAGAQVFDLTASGPHDVGEAPAAATHYDQVNVRVAPAVGLTAGNASDEQVAAMEAGGWSVAAAGVLTCGGESVTFDWAFDTDTTYYCEPDDLTIPRGGEKLSELTIHGDHLFYDGLENPDAEVRGQAIHDADADRDGVVTLSELQAVSVAGLGYQVGQYSEVEDLAAFVRFLTQTLGHIDGEGHCQVDL